MTLRFVHRISAFIIGTFACLHIANHLTSLSSISLHLEFMTEARKYYRQPFAEALLTICVVFQIASGLWLVFREGTRRRGLIPWLQAISGAYLAMFLLVHVGAIFVGRTVLDLDTNFYFAAAGFHVEPFQYLFAPYYFFAVLAFCTHVGCALYWKFQSSSRTLKTIVVVLPMFAGGIISLLIVLSLAGIFHPIDLPAPYRAVYEPILKTNLQRNRN